MPVVKVEEVEERPGGAANVAVNIATLGGQVRVLGVARPLTRRRRCWRTSYIGWAWPAN